MNKITVVHETDLEILGRFDTVEEAEDFVAEFEKTDPEGLHRGDYGIDVPEELSR